MKKIIMVLLSLVSLCYCSTSKNTELKSKKVEVTDSLILNPSDQQPIIHRGHAAHASHASHYSHYSSI